MEWTKIAFYLLLLGGMSTLFAATVSGVWAAGPFSPARLASASDVVVHGTVTTVESSGGLPTDRYEVNHPVTVRVADVFKGAVGDSIRLQVGGDTDTYISTAANFTEGEEVTVMLQQQNASAHPHIDTLYYLTAGSSGKYTITDGTVEIREPEQKNITTEQMKEIVQNPETVNITELSAQSPDDEAETGSNEQAETQDGFFAQLWQYITSTFM